MKVPKASKGGFSGQVNNALKDVKTNMSKNTVKGSNSKMPAVQEKVSDRLYGQPRGKSQCGMDDKMLSRLKTSKRGI